MPKLPITDQFVSRHIGINPEEENAMLKAIGLPSLEALIYETVPDDILIKKPLNLPEAMSEYEYLRELKETAAMNKPYRSYIGLGYYGTITPSPIKRNVFENPGWYTQYTPYQAEIAQGRLEALLNFQTMVSDLTDLPIANASLLDEGTAAAEAMTMFFGVKNKRRKKDPAMTILVADKVFPQTKAVLETRAEPLGIKVKCQDWKSFDMNDNDVFAILLQYPDSDGAVEDYEMLAQAASEKEIYVIVAADIMSLALLKAPGAWGADAVVGTTQRFGVPMGYGGPHAAYFATSEKYKRLLPGRIIGISQDKNGNTALRMALQTREQHIKRDKATSNICTAQALLAIMASMYAVYHGQEGIKAIAKRIHLLTNNLKEVLEENGFKVVHQAFFDTILVDVGRRQQSILDRADAKEINFRAEGDTLIAIALDEATLTVDIDDILYCFSIEEAFSARTKNLAIPSSLLRQSKFLTHPVFKNYHTETKLMRYIKSLENKDLSLTHSMIPLGSCTMKLNAATQLIPVSWSEFANIHPFAPSNQTLGYKKIIKELGEWLCEITGFDACSFQPNSGAQGEYTGLLTIRAYHLDRNEGHRQVALIPSSAHGTNPASAVMAGMKVVVVKCDDDGNIDVEDLRSKAIEHKDNLSALMVTYPSTHGVFESAIIEICQIIHEHGGLVYMDGANMNAQCGITSPARIGADVCHLNLHKTFSIPHGGGGPGMGPICVNTKLAPYLPNHKERTTGGGKGISSVSSAPYGSASILLISYAYIKMLGQHGVTEATKYAILNANYIKSRLENYFDVLYLGVNGRTAHELILDLRHLRSNGLSAEDIAKRFIDYGFHAPTLSFPVPGTIMIEPTESESQEELDRFCEAMIAIRVEIDEVASGEYSQEDNVLVNAPHTIAEVTADEWTYSYSREKAAYPITYLKERPKFWASVKRVDNAYGDRNLICTCPPVEMYAEG